MLLQWDSFWATNKKVIDPIAGRYTAIETTHKVPVTVVGAPKAPRTEMKDLHAKFSIGQKKVVYSENILMEQVDAASFEQDEEITLMNWGNAIVRKISHSILDLGKTVTGIELELHLQGS